MSAASYIEETTEGGLSAYVDNQNKRYAEAVASGDAGLIARLAADSQRVGYTLGGTTLSIGGGGAANTGVGAGRGGYMYDGTVVSTDLGSQLGGIASGVGGYLGYVIVGVAVLLGIKIIS